MFDLVFYYLVQQHGSICTLQYMFHTSDNVNLTFNINGRRQRKQIVTLRYYVNRQKN